MLNQTSALYVLSFSHMYILLFLEGHAKNPPMKYLALLLFVFSLNSYAITWEIIGPCGNRPEINGSELVDIKKSVGVISVDIFKANNIDFIGDDNGIASILNTPIGSQAIEVLSDTKMRAYGWCYQVDGIEPGVMPNEFYFSSKESHLRWVYGYSTYESGSWVGYCDLAHELDGKSKFIKNLCD
jgi:hypothetical protein